jgi:hypothetical protein
MNPILTPPLYVFKIHFNIILPCTPRYSWLFALQCIFSIKKLRDFYKGNKQQIFMVCLSNDIYLFIVGNIKDIYVKYEVLLNKLSTFIVDICLFVTLVRKRVISYVEALLMAVDKLSSLFTDSDSIHEEQ